MTNDKLRQAFELMKAGNKQEAKTLVREVLKVDGKNERAWWMLVHLLDDDDKKRHVAERVLAINPSHAGALRFLQLAENSNDAPSEKKKQTKDPDWSKLEQREREGFKNKGNKNSIGRRILRGVASMIVFFIIPRMLFFAYNYIPVGNISGPPPEEVVISQFTAGFNGDIETMRALTCDRVEEQWIDLYNDLQREAQSSGFGKFIFDFTDVELVVQSRKARQVTIEFTGQINVTAAGQTITMGVDELVEAGQEQGLIAVLVVREQQWVVCSA